MTRPETVAYFAKVRQCLKEARVCAANELPEAAGRAAYLAAFHAAQALIFERAGRAAKSHNGVRSEFARLAKEHPSIDPRFPTFLARAYNLKAVADYAIGEGATVDLTDAREAIGGAEEFVGAIEALLQQNR
jgi:uncharacterized protein (UPF0332 family)